MEVIQNSVATAVVEAAKQFHLLGMYGCSAVTRPKEGPRAVHRRGDERH